LGREGEGRRGMNIGKREKKKGKRRKEEYSIRYSI
jgi:hypothetical protein